MNNSIGYVYVLTNEHVPDLVKVGYTSRDPRTRAAELSNVTGVPGKWIVYHSWKIENQYEAEQQVFAELKQHRETGEFLKLRPRDAVEAISVVRAANETIGPDDLSPIAREEAEKIPNDKILRHEQEKLKRMFTQIDKELRGVAKQASDSMFEVKVPLMKRNRIRNAFLWWIGVFLVALIFVPKTEGALILGVTLGTKARAIRSDKGSRNHRLVRSCTPG